MASISAVLCVLLGILSLFLNLFVIVALLRNRRRVLKNVFYVIVLNCAILDLLRGVCLILATGSYIYLTIVGFNRNLFNVTRYSKWVLRQCNLMTILNLLVFTSNEFVVIRYPLYYRRYCHRRVVLLILLICWFVSILFGLGLTFTGYRDEGEGSEGLIILFVLCYLCLFIVLVCYGFILRTIRQFHSADAGDFQSTGGQRINNRKATAILHPKSCVDCDRNSSRRCDSHRKRNHLMSRHKYLIVIGTVLLVDVLFLFPYSGIQILNFLHLRRYVDFTVLTRAVKWLLNIMIGVHSVCQPLCYFRMTEFRRLACCSSRQWDKSKTFSQHKSFGNTRSAMRDEDCDGVELLAPENSPKGKAQLIEHARMVVAPIKHDWSSSDHGKFRRYNTRIDLIPGRSCSSAFQKSDEQSVLAHSMYDLSRRKSTIQFQESTTTIPTEPGTPNQADLVLKEDAPDLIQN